MIASFKGGITERIWNGERTRLARDIQRRALMKLRYIHAETCRSTFIRLVKSRAGIMVKSRSLHL